MSTTTESIADYIYTVDDVTTTIPGGSQTFQLRTGGWGWLFGGGLEVWVSSRFGVYGEFTYTELKGDNLDLGEGSINDRLFLIFGGVRVHLGR
jgi:hypothetical protein